MLDEVKPKLQSLSTSNVINIKIPSIKNLKCAKNHKLLETSLSTFYQAACDGHFEKVKNCLCSFGKDKKKVNIKDDNQTSALHYAVKYGHFSIVKLLVENGANINIQDENEATPLHYACRYMNKKKQLVLNSDFQSSFVEEQKHSWFGQSTYFSKFQTKNINTFLVKKKKLSETIIKKEQCFQNSFNSSQDGNNTKATLPHIEMQCLNKQDFIPVQDYIEKKRFSYDKGRFIQQGGFQNKKFSCGQLENKTKFSFFEKKMLTKNIISSHFLNSSSSSDDLSTCHRLSTLGDSCTGVIKKSVSINDVYCLKPEVFQHKLEERNQGDVILVYLLEQNSNVNAKDYHSSTPLHYAVMKGNSFATEQLLLQTNIQIEAADQAKMTPLHCAVSFGSYEACKLLLEHGCNIFCRNKENMTPLHFAASEGHFDVALLLLENARKMSNDVFNNLINCVNSDQETALHLAVENNHLYIVDLCIKHGFNVNCENKNMVTPLHQACTSGFIKIAQLLVENGANIESMNSFKETPLHKAALFNRVDIIQYLLERGAYIDCRDKDNETPLLMAVRKNNSESVQMLLDYQADITVKDANDKTCLFIAAEENSKDVIKILCQKDLTCILNVFNKNEMTPLHIASKEGHDSIVQVLMDLGACIDAKNHENLTPLHFAAKYGHLRTVEILLSFKVLSIVNDEDIFSNTPLHLASMHGHVKVVEILIKSGADVEARNEGLWTPLDFAAFYGQTKCAEYLLNSDSLVNPKEKYKVSSLQLACKEGHVAMVNLLLSKNADISWKDHLGKNCLDYAIDNKRRKVVTAIIANENWKIALRNSTFDGRKITTPLRKLIKKLPDIAEQVFNQCITGNGLPIEHPYYKQTCCYEFLEDLFTSWGPNLSKCIEKKNQYFNSYGLNANKLIFTEKLKGIFSFELYTTEVNHSLDVMVKSHHTRLLYHPLVTHFIRRKWRLCGRYVYYSKLLLYLLFLTFVSSYILSIHNNVHGNVCIEKDTNVTSCYCQPLKKALNQKVNFLISFERYIVLILSTTSLSIEVVKLLNEVHNYFQLRKLVELSSYICAMVFALNNPSSLKGNISFRCSTWYRGLGAATVTLSWLSLTIFMRQFPKLGTYIFIYTNIMKTFAQFFVIFMLFIISFGLGLHLVMSDVTTYSVPSRALSKMIVGMTGEFSADSLYNNVNLPLRLPVAWALLILFVIVNCIAVMKLLMGLAIGEINDIKKQAVLNRLATLVNLTLCVEKTLPNSLRNKLVVMEESFYPNLMKTSSLWSFWSFESPISNSNKMNDLKIIKKQHKKMNARACKLRDAMKEMETQNDRIENMLNVISKRLQLKQ
ncbi:transient receptor potential cation channel subfamily A member 1 isoform X3 [Hydra vulgaris]|uniref:Transient receptor potential cation channel subfamily A member 1 isoform X3 n=1 Tax=Hydra vulgaris TaxID=6087 RepID=A0ABM4BJI4_HYDVU